MVSSALHEGTLEAFSSSWSYTSRITEVLSRYTRVYCANTTSFDLNLLKQCCAYGLGAALGRMVVKRPPLLLSGDWNTIKNIVRILKQFQFHDRIILKIVSKYPVLLCMDIAQLKRNTDLLHELIPIEEELLIMVSTRPDILINPQAMVKVCRSELY